MIAEYRDKDGTTHIIDAEYLEVREVTSGEIKNGTWIFKDYKEEKDDGVSRADNMGRHETDV